LFHLLVADEAGLLEDGCAVREDDEVGDTAHLKAGRELGICLGVDLEDDGFAGHIGGGAGDLRGCGSAGTAPGCPEVDEDGDLRVPGDVVEEGGVGGQGLGERWKRGLAGAAAAGVGEVLGGDTVFLLAVSAGADDGHGEVSEGWPDEQAQD
jgi:hypothetical protein